MRRARIGRGVVLAAIAVVCMGAAASIAVGASLTVLEKPKIAHSGGHYHVTIKGRYKASQISQAPFLLAVIQYSSAKCLKTAKAEFGRTGASFFVHGTPKHNPFTIKASFTASAAGPRRVCAYLYGKPVGPSDNATPIARASAAFRVS